MDDEQDPNGHLDWMQKCNAAASLARSIADHLGAYARDVQFMSGDTPFARCLEDLMKRARLAESLIQSVPGAVIDEQMKRNAESSRNMLTACIAGVAIGKPDLSGEEQDALRRLVEPQCRGAV